MPFSLKPYLIILGSIILLLLLIAVLRMCGFEREFTSWTERNQPVVKLLVVTLFMLFGAAAVPVFLKLFLFLQHRAGNSDQPFVMLLNRHGIRFVYAAWVLFGLGLLISLPVMIRQGFFSNQA